MLRTIETLSSYQLGAADGPIGTVKDFYFDDEHWALRYLVVEVSKWLPGKQVLVSPMAIETVDWRKRLITVNLTRDQIRNGPAVGTAEPVSRQYEIAFNTYFGYPPYWPGPGAWAWAPYPSELARSGSHPTPGAPDLTDVPHSHLRSANEVKGYHIQATDQEIGHVEDFVLDDESWVIRYLIVDTSNWLGGRLVLIAPEWVDDINWHLSNVHVQAESEDIRESPEFEPSDLNRTFENQLWSHYERLNRRARRRPGSTAV